MVDARFEDDNEKARPPMLRGEVLDTAKALVNGERTSYGDARLHFTMVGVHWAALLHAAGWIGPDGEGVPPHIVVLMMNALKMQRAAFEPTREDHWVDQAGYAALGGEIGVGQ